MPERWGIKTTSDDGYINLHSDYSSMVYYAEMLQNTNSVRPVYTGDNYVPISETQKTTFYDMGWVVQFKLTNINTEFLLPFYLPAFSGQQIGILDVIRKDATTWLVNLIYSGNETNTPRVFAFAPLNAMPRPVMEGRWGLNVFDQNNRLVFTDNKQPLRVDDVLLITHPSTIKTGARGTCGNSKSCHINFTSDQTATYTGTATNSSTKLYHIVPSAYGGLAYKDSDSGRGDCGLLELGRYEYAWVYQSWASFRGTVGHIWGTRNHTVDWLSDFAGGYHQFKKGSCGLSGILGFILGGLLTLVTLGAGLVFLVGGALVGFALAGVDSVPSLKAYDADETIDTNTASNLIITDLKYYNISEEIETEFEPYPPGPVPLEYVYSNTFEETPVYWSFRRFRPENSTLPFFGTLEIYAVYPATETTPSTTGMVRIEDFSSDNTIESVTFQGVTYYRGNFVDESLINVYDPVTNVFIGIDYTAYYELGIIGTP